MPSRVSLHLSMWSPPNLEIGLMFTVGVFAISMTVILICVSIQDCQDIGGQT
ncbi:MAG: hypothetical protein ACQJCO_09430 [cyanobacterium endosymbiont of Rhopalodia sterrenbergii]